MSMATNETKDELLVRKNIFVNASPERAFDVFTQKMATWWPLETHKIGKAKAIDARFEMKPGGRAYEIGEDGTECTWGTVLVVDRPRRFVWRWELSATWQHDASIDTEIDVTFVAENGGTRVTLEHRKLGAYGDKALEMKKTLSGEGAWGKLLELFAKAASAA
jgi:uncharacterized protein YndB with AHSA1/START domain